MDYSEILRTVDQFGYAAAESSAGAIQYKKCRFTVRYLLY